MSLILTTDCDELRKEFFNLKENEDIATLLEIRYQDLIYYLYRIPEAKRYKTHIPHPKVAESENIR